MQKILIVDDTINGIKVLMEALRGFDYDILAATNGRQALEIATTQKPDLILLDIVMPKMDGYEVCKQLQEDTTTQKIPVIFITARGEEEDETKGFELGAVDYITKPISFPIVQARVKTHIKLKLAYEELEQQNAILEETAIYLAKLDLEQNQLSQWFETYSDKRQKK